MAVTTQINTIKRNRFWEIDLLRTIAIVGMITFHTLDLLYYFNLYPTNILYGPWWWSTRAVNAGMFIFLAGVALTITYSRGGKISGFMVRGLKIFGCGMALTLITLLISRTEYIRFGILHFFGIAFILAPFFARFRFINLVLGIALIVMFNTGFLVLTGTWMILALSYTIRKMPFIARSSSSILYQLDPAMEEASISLGVNPMKTFFKVTIRLMAGGIIAGAILTWVTTISELSSTIVLQTPGWSTMTVEMFQGILSDDMGMASAFASILIVSAIVPLLIIIGRFKEEGSSLF